MCSRARLVTYLPGLHVLVHRVAGARTLSTAGSLAFDEPHVAITTSDMGIPLIFMLLHIFSMLSVHPPICTIFVNTLSLEDPERISSNLLEEIVSVVKGQDQCDLKKHVLPLLQNSYTN